MRAPDRSDEEVREAPCRAVVHERGQRADAARDGGEEHDSGQHPAVDERGDLVLRRAGQRVREPVDLESGEEQGVQQEQDEAAEEREEHVEPVAEEQPQVAAHDGEDDAHAVSPSARRDDPAVR